MLDSLRNSDIVDITHQGVQVRPELLEIDGITPGYEKTIAINKFTNLLSAVGRSAVHFIDRILTKSVKE